MLYHLLYGLRNEADWLHWLNVVRYLPIRIIAAWLTAMITCFAVYPWFIRRLQEKQIGQPIRDDGPERHLSKAGTPTMGGSLILLALVVSTVLWVDLHNKFVWLTLAVTSGFGLIGFVDDALKLKRGSSKGLSGKVKLLGQFLLAVMAMIYLFYGQSLPADWLALRDHLAFPFAAFHKHSVNIPPALYVAFAAVVIVGMSNAVNLTDGLDGLAMGPVMVCTATYMIMSYLAGLTLFGINVARYLDIPSLKAAGELTVLCGAMIGAGIGFLWYNTYPAQVFMGDVGSLPLGGALGMMAVLTKNEFLTVILGGIFVLETLSVITQVVSFQLFGKRVFRMAPVHHHFELKGWAEPKIIVRFWIIAIMLALVSLSSLKLR